MGLMKPAEVTMSRAAERAGNLAWALEELADSRMRRFVLRLRAWYNALIPLVVGLYGLWVMSIAASLILPLIQLIQMTT
jgi:type II secretory pathway component PulF